LPEDNGLTDCDSKLIPVVEDILNPRNNRIITRANIFFISFPTNYNAVLIYLFIPARRVFNNKIGEGRDRGFGKYEENHTKCYLPSSGKGDRRNN
jgi:hypothetical protein